MPAVWNGLDGYGGAVGGYLGHDAADLVAVEAHGDDRVGSSRPSFAPHALAGLVAAVGQQRGISRHLSAGQGPELSAHVAEKQAHGGPYPRSRAATAGSFRVVKPGLGALHH